MRRKAQFADQGKVMIGLLLTIAMIAIAIAVILWIIRIVKKPDDSAKTLLPLMIPFVRVKLWNFWKKDKR